VFAVNAHTATFSAATSVKSQTTANTRIAKRSIDAMAVEKISVTAVTTFGADMLAITVMKIQTTKKM